MKLVEKLAIYGSTTKRFFSTYYRDVFLNQTWSPHTLVNTDAISRIIKRDMFEHTGILVCNVNHISVESIGTRQKPKWRVGLDTDAHYNLATLFFRMSPHFNVVEYGRDDVNFYFVVEHAHKFSD